MIAIINYGSGNVRAIGNIYDRLNIEYKIVNEPKEIDNSISKLILPGVGSFDHTIETLFKSGFKEILDELVLGKSMPVLGICVGMQILSEGSEEGNKPGLGWIPGHVKKFDLNQLVHKPKIPHLGWNSIEVCKSTSLLDKVDSAYGFYFIHSYYFECANSEDILTKTHYGIDFCSALNRNNIYGTQFHPEKSHSNGIKLLMNFSKL